MLNILLIKMTASETPKSSTVFVSNFLISSYIFYTQDLIIYLSKFGSGMDFENTLFMYLVHVEI